MGEGSSPALRPDTSRLARLPGVLLPSKSSGTDKGLCRDVQLSWVVRGWLCAGQQECPG